MIQAFYAASDGGYTEDVEDVWHGGNPAYAIPYLRGVCDPGEYTSANPWTDWTRTFTASSLSSRLAPYTGGIGSDQAVHRCAARRLGTDRPARSCAGPVGPPPSRATSSRRALGLPDGRVWINTNRNDRGRGPSEVRRADVPAGLAEVYRDHARPRIPSALRTRRDLPQRPGRPHDLAEGRDPDRVPRRPAAHEAASDSRSPTRCRCSGPPRRPTCCACRRIILEYGRIYFKPGVGAHALVGTGAVGLPLDRGGDTERARIPEDAGAPGERGPTGVLRARDDRVRERQLRRQRRLRLSTGRCPFSGASPGALERR